MSKVNRATYEQLVRDNLAWLKAQPDTLENAHIRHIVADSVRTYYPEEETRFKDGTPFNAKDEHLEERIDADEAAAKADDPWQLPLEQQVEWALRMFKESTVPQSVNVPELLRRVLRRLTRVRIAFEAGFFANIGGTTESRAKRLHRGEPYEWTFTGIPGNKDLEPQAFAAWAGTFRDACCPHAEGEHETSAYRGSKTRHCLVVGCPCKRFHR